MHPSPHIPSLRETLQKAAQESNLTLEQLAEKSGVSRKALYLFFKGEADPRLSTIEGVAHALGMSLFAAPKAVEAMQLHQPVRQEMSEHSRVGRLLKAHGQKPDGV